MLIRRTHCCLTVVHVQTRLAAAVHNSESVITNLRVLLESARRLDVPVLVPELNPRGLGSTIPALADLTKAYGQEEPYFSCMRDRDFSRRLHELRRDQVVVAGMEAHVCVLQAAMDMLKAGIQVFVVEDAVSSRRPENSRVALERLRDAGAAIVTTEMVAFEWMERADIPEFRDILKLIK